MSIVIAGGPGSPAPPLARARPADGHDVIILTRQNAASVAGHTHTASVTWTPDGSTGPWAQVVSGATAVINLACESIAAKRWSAAQKQTLRDSRLLATRSLTSAIRQAARPPGAFI